MTEFDLDQLSAVLWSLREYLPELVIVGGWVPALYRISGVIPSWTSAVSRTTEVDVVLPPDVPSTGRPPVTAALRQSDFAPLDSGPAFAVWQRGGVPGAKIEFLTPLVGRQRDVGTVRAIHGQTELGAIRLPDLAFSYRFATTLPIVIPVKGTKDKLLEVRVSRLGAFLVTRGAVFQQRRAAADRQKPGKDLLYIRDVLAGGRDVVAHVQGDLRLMVRDSAGARDYVAYAANNVRLALHGDSEAIEHASAMFAEREGAPPETARADVRGFLTDYVELLEEAVESASY